MSAPDERPPGIGDGPEWVARASGARLVHPGAPAGDPGTAGGAGPAEPGGPRSVVIDSRLAGPGALFVGIAGTRVDGGDYAERVLAAGAWGVLVTPAHAERLAAADAPSGVVLTHPDPVLALGALARAWRGELGASVVGITGSVGKTSTKDLLAAMLAPQRRVVASPQNFNTEIGLPLTVLGAARGTEVLVLEMGMRGAGQIAVLGQIAEPDVAVITNVGPVHLEQLGSLEAVAAEKAALVGALAPGATAVLPAGERLLEPHHRADVTTLTFGPGGAVDALPEGLRLPAGLPGPVRANALAAVAAARALGVEPTGQIDIALSDMRGQRLHLAGDIVVVVDCYNANPMSMRAALEDLAGGASGRTVAVLGDMLELGPDARRHHAEIGAHATQLGIDRLVAVGDLSRHLAAGFTGGEPRWVPDAATAAELVPGMLEPGDTVLLKASRGIGLEAVADALRGADGAAGR